MFFPPPLCFVLGGFNSSTCLLCLEGVFLGYLWISRVFFLGLLTEKCIIHLWFVVL